MHEGHWLSRVDDHRHGLWREDRNRSVYVRVRYLLHKNNGMSVFRECNCHEIESSEGTCKEDPAGRYSTAYDGPQFQRYLEHLRQRSWGDGCRRHRLDIS